MAAPIHSGILFKLGGGSLHVWQQRYFEVVGKELRYYDGDKPSKSAFKGAIPLEMATIHDRGSAGPDKPCFSIGPGAVSKKGGKEYFLHAPDSGSKYEWLAALCLATGNSIYGYLSSSGDSDEREATVERIAKCPLAVAGILKKRGNDVCADCGGDLPTWAVVSDDTGVLVCIECIGVHRMLWSSRCKEVQLDQWSDEAVDLVRERGNEKVNAELEFLVGFDTPKPLPQSARDVREAFIRAKYQDRKFTKAATGALAPRQPQRDIAARTTERSVSVTVPPKYMGVLFFIPQRAVCLKKGKLPCNGQSVLVMANGFQHVVSKKSSPVTDAEFGDGVQWNEPMQLGVVNMQAPMTLSVMESAAEPSAVTVTFSLTPSQFELSDEPKLVSVPGEDKNRQSAQLLGLLSFQGLI